MSFCQPIEVFEMFFLTNEDIKSGEALTWSHQAKKLACAMHLHTDKRTQRLKTNGNLQWQTDKDAEMTIVLAHKDEHSIVEHVHVAER